MKRSGPPKRRTPLRRKTPLRATRASKPSSDRASRSRKPKAPPPSARWNGWRNRQREEVKRRSWRCESVEYCAQPAVDVHHTFGRVGEPWASSKLTCLHLCRPHHDRADSDYLFRERLRMVALERIAAYLGSRIAEVRSLVRDMIRTDPPRATYEWLVQHAKSAAIGPPDWREESDEAGDLSDLRDSSV